MALGRCYRLDGAPKVRYPDLESALRSAGEVNAKNLARGRAPVAPYRCQAHRCYHLGRTPRYRVHDVPGLREELGERVFGNLVSENQRNWKRRRRVLIGRIMAAEIRRATDEAETRNREMYRLYSEEEWTLQELADEFGISRGRVWQVFRERSWPRRRRGPRSVADQVVGR